MKCLNVIVSYGGRAYKIDKNLYIYIAIVSFQQIYATGVTATILSQQSFLSSSFNSKIDDFISTRNLPLTIKLSKVSLPQQVSCNLSVAMFYSKSILI